MTKKVLNQNAKYDQQLVNTIEPDFLFSNKPINRFKVIKNTEDHTKSNKKQDLFELKKQINSIENCNLKDNSKNFVMINIKREKVYSTYLINFRPLKDRKPTGQEIKRYSIFLKQHISIINPKIIILMGSSAMEGVTGINKGISNERGKWKEIILKNKTFPLLITFSPSYLIRFPENKKYSWEDLKKIRHKIQKLDIKI